MRPESGFTLLFEALVLTLATDMPIKAVADLVEEKQHSDLADPASLRGVPAGGGGLFRGPGVGIYETASKRGHNYISLFVDLERSKVLFATEGKGCEHGGGVPAGSGGAWGRGGADGRDLHGHVSGLHPRSAADLPARLADVRQVPRHEDPGRAVDEVRRAEQKERPRLVGSRYVWLKNEGNRTKNEGNWTSGSGKPWSG
jgi:transposase